MIHGLFKPHDDMSIVMYVFKLNEEATTKHQSLFSAVRFEAGKSVFM